MKLNNEVWAFIPARSGSKSIQNKNIVLLKKMKLNNEVWAFVPARSGSKSIKNKNIVLLKKNHY